MRASGKRCYIFSDDTDWLVYGRDRLGVQQSFHVRDIVKYLSWQLGTDTARRHHSAFSGGFAFQTATMSTPPTGLPHVLRRLACSV